MGKIKCCTCGKTVKKKDCIVMREYEKSKRRMCLICYKTELAPHVERAFGRWSCAKREGSPVI